MSGSATESAAGWRNRIVGEGVEDPAQLLANPLNFRRHPKDQQEALAGALEEIGWIQRVVVNQRTGHVIDGHLRIELALRNDERAVPVVYVDLTEDEERIALATLDPIAALADTDSAMLTRLLEGVRAGNSDLQAFLDELNPGRVEPGTGNTDPDDCPPEPKIVTTRTGEIWILGNHRIICGDSTDRATVAALLAGEQPHIMVTDPPYGVEYDPTWRAAIGLTKSKGKMGKVHNDDRADWREAWALFPGDVAYVWHGALHAVEVAASLEACGFQIRSQIIWEKDRMALSRGHYHWHHEPCFYAVKDMAPLSDGEAPPEAGLCRRRPYYAEHHLACWYAVREGGTGHWSGDRSQTTVWKIPAREDSGHGHGTQKPVDCMRRPIENNSRPGEAVYEPFSGSGTTIIAAEMMQRRCYAVELDPAYVDIAVLRWQEFTGRQAVRECDGRSFDELSREAAAGGKRAGEGA